MKGDIKRFKAANTLGHRGSFKHGFLDCHQHWGTELSLGVSLSTAYKGYGWPHRRWDQSSWNKHRVVTATTALAHSGAATLLVFNLLAHSHETSLLYQEIPGDFSQTTHVYNVFLFYPSDWHICISRWHLSELLHLMMIIFSNPNYSCNLGSKPPGGSTLFKRISFFFLKT